MTDFPQNPHGSLQLRTYRRARRDGADTAAAAILAGISLGEARLIDADDARSPPPPSAFEEPQARGFTASPQGEIEMARKAKPGDTGGQVTNLSETKEVIREAVGKIISLRSERKEINAAIGEQRARVKNYGVPPAALDLALRMKEADPEDRQKHDEGYAIARDALGLGLQRSLFEALDERLDADSKAAAGKAAQQKPEPQPGPEGDADLAGERVLVPDAF